MERGLFVGRKEEGGFVAAERLKVVAAVMCLCNADRVVMSVAIVPLAAKYGWSTHHCFLRHCSGEGKDYEFWAILFALEVDSHPFCGDTCFPLFSEEHWSDRYGGKKVIASGAALWSLATLITPWAANHSTNSLLAVRAFFGLAEGVALPVMNHLLSRWFPNHERATSVGLSMGGFQLGNVVGLVLAPLLMQSIGISGPFVLFTALGLLCLLGAVACFSSCTNISTFFKQQDLVDQAISFNTLDQVIALDYRLHQVTNDPQECGSISKSELWLIQAGKADSSVIKGSPPSLRHMLSKLPAWAIIFANFTNKWVFDVNLKQAAWFSAVPWGTMALSGYIAGAASDYLIKSGYSTTSARKIMQSIGFIGPGIALLCLNHVRTPTIAAVFLTAALSLSSFSQAGFLLNMQDIAPQCARFLHGISNSAGTLAAIISTIGTGYFVQWLGSFQAFLTLTACLYFATAIFWNLYATGERVF
ncbi:hypothetical protein SASPL_102021 [Salvia splendens]|uniref:MFS transporter n=1 Tax=Salvia splendens TaxID=180675 RepID=A0A8X9ADR0_SALSN|nr:hypothetical protein SASPL_102021 [Salvia splendens]